MLIKRTAMWLLAWGTLVLLSGRALAQPANSNLDYQSPNPTYENGSAPYSNANPTHPAIFPFNPPDVEPRWDWFGPAETSGYGNGPRPKIGFFGSYERVFWSLSKPITSQIGSPTAIPPSDIFTTLGTNTADTGFLLANGAWGNRYEIGYWDTRNRGWLVGVLEHVSQGQYRVDQNVSVQFNDPQQLLNGFSPVTILGNTVLVDFGKLPVRFETLTMKNITTLNGVELMRMYRPHRLHSGGFFELLYGARYLQIADTFVVQGFNTNLTTDTTGTGGSTAGIIGFFNPLSDSTWATRAQNNLIGPQIGGRWSNQRGHWIFSLEARFLAAVNMQNVHQTTSLATNLVTNNLTILNTAAFFTPLNFQGIGTDSHSYATTFSPVGELRVQTTYQLTSNVGLKFGYTGLGIGNITRASNRVDYSSPNLIGITTAGTHQSFFSNGINLGVEVNR